MATRARFVGLVLGTLLPCLVGCQDNSVKVPDAVWEAAMAYCEHRMDCTGNRFFEHYSSLEDCADIKTKYFRWDRYTEECIEAHIATFECEAAKPCYPESYSCDLPYQLLSYHCWRFDTAYWGWNCGMDATDFAECNEFCSGGDDIHVYALCSAETPDYCQCRNETCQEGEYCCYCEQTW